MSQFSIKEIRAARLRSLAKKDQNFQVGNLVEIVKSPYESVKPGTQAIIEKIRYNHGRTGDHLYILAGLSHQAFWASEIRKVEQ